MKNEKIWKNIQLLGQARQSRDSLWSHEHVIVVVIMQDPPPPGGPLVSPGGRGSQARGISQPGGGGLASHFHGTVSRDFVTVGGARPINTLSQRVLVFPLSIYLQPCVFLFCFTFKDQEDILDQAAISMKLKQSFTLNVLRSTFSNNERALFVGVLDGTEGEGRIVWGKHCVVQP